MNTEEKVKLILEKIKKEDKKINSFIYINPNAIKEARTIDQKKEKGKLAGLIIAIKSNICVKNMLTSCASKTLENFYAPYDADVIKKIKAEDGLIIGMTNCDEFACGSSGETSFYQETHNPSASGYIPGGSSSGSAAAVAAGFCDISLGSDTGGSIRNPASNCGVVGIKPSYGRVSRYGLIDLTMSLDQIGPIAKNVKLAALMMEVISGKSENDPTTYEKTVPQYSNFKPLSNITIGLSEDFKNLCEDKEIYNKVQSAVQNLTSKHNLKIKNINLKHINLAVQSYYILNYAEFFSATRKFDGLKYGHKIEDTCGPEVLRRILGGGEILQAEYHGLYYRKALKVKQLISQEFQKAFSEVDVIISPTVPKLPHKIGEVIEDQRAMYAYDAYTIPANLAGICAGSINIGKLKGIPVGLQVMAPSFKEDLMFNVLNALEKIYEENKNGN